MNAFNKKGLSQKAFVAISSLVIALGLGAASVPAALADEAVNVKGVEYEVRHNGNGPYIDVKGVRYYLQDGRVTINGVVYGESRDDHHDRDRHEEDRHHRDHHEGDHHEGDHHHKDHHKD